MPTLLEVVLHPERRKASPEPLPVSLVPVFRFGVLVWLVALVVTAVLRWSDLVSTTAVWVCATGALLGAAGYVWARSRPGR